ncbi:MAG: 2-oxoacid:acceptor oxidoreductase family protein [Clostridia bacterium]|nr:2-oxoacid:acceptor oxidoreductase family protein [Clostridia bacterium]MBR6754363.1 2-oxoacid:acceptor oxidoreductase family protein [Clostridia bacterium]
MSAILLAGFGGQGILFAGKQLVLAGMKNDKQVSWLPSYGPEMRGGTCNCSVNIDDEPIGSPLVTTPDILIAMNKPSLLKFEGRVAVGGSIVIDSSLIDVKTSRDDVTAYYIPATQMANDAGFPKLANVIILGHLIKKTGLFDADYFMECIKASAPKAKPELGEMNAKALQMGYDYIG